MPGVETLAMLHQGLAAVPAHIAHMDAPSHVPEITATACHSSYAAQSINPWL